MKKPKPLLLLICICAMNIGCQFNRTIDQNYPTMIIPHSQKNMHEIKTGEIRIVPGKGIELKLPDQWINIGPYLNSHMSSGQYLMALISQLFLPEEIHCKPILNNNKPKKN